MERTILEMFQAADNHANQIFIGHTVYPALFDGALLEVNRLYLLAGMSISYLEGMWCIKQLFFRGFVKYPGVIGGK